jgi:hypothetical protein
MTVEELKAILDTIPNDAELWIFASPHYVAQLKEVKYNVEYNEVDLS